MTNKKKLDRKQLVQCLKEEIKIVEENVGT